MSVRRGRGRHGSERFPALCGPHISKCMETMTWNSSSQDDRPAAFVSEIGCLTVFFLCRDKHTWVDRQDVAKFRHVTRAERMTEQNKHDTKTMCIV